MNPSIATEPGELRMAFNREAVVAPGSQALTFDKQESVSLRQFQENNGAAEVVVAATSPAHGEFHDRTHHHRTRPLATAPPQTAHPSPQAATVAPPPSAPPTPVVRHYFVVVDPSHGGAERGAPLTDQLAEKDVTLAFARRLRQELELRGLVTLLLRDGDTTLTLDRAPRTLPHPAIHLCVVEGRRRPRLQRGRPSGTENHGPFSAGMRLKLLSAPLSRSAGSGLVRSLQSKQIQARSLIAPLRPLNNITTVALALEVAPSSDDVSQLNSPAYQQAIAAAIATGIADFHDKLEVTR